MPAVGIGAAAVAIGVGAIAAAQVGRKKTETSPGQPTD
jgi:hypothetical protein